MKKDRYIKQFNEILASLRLEYVNGNIQSYFYTWVKAHIEKIHSIMNITGKTLVFRAMYLALLENSRIRSPFEIYAYLLVSIRFKKHIITELCRNWLIDYLDKT